MSAETLVTNDNDYAVAINVVTCIRNKSTDDAAREIAEYRIAERERLVTAALLLVTRAFREEHREGPWNFLRTEVAKLRTP